MGFVDFATFYLIGWLEREWGREGDRFACGGCGGFCSVGR